MTDRRPDPLQAAPPTSSRVGNATPPRHTAPGPQAQPAEGRDDITVRLPRHLVEQIRDLAHQHDRSLSAELREALRRYTETTT